VIGEPMMTVTAASAIVLLETDHAQAPTLKDQHVHAIEKAVAGVRVASRRAVRSGELADIHRCIHSL